jgi:hypothetical protein
MKKFAVLNGENVVNTIVADSKAIAEEVTGLTCVEYTVEKAECGGTYINGIFTPRKPFASWILDANNSWQAPVPYPELDEENSISYMWDEDNQSWNEVVIDE